MAKRGETEGKKAKALQKGLRAMFRTLEQRPVPEPIRAVVDQLDEAARKTETPGDKKP
jgi:hypothetical protein